MSNLLTIREASKWATIYLQKKITTSNISYLIQYGIITKNGENGSVLINQKELEKYYKSQLQEKNEWKEKCGSDLNWALSFSEYKESETTKHVHRLHPYKGKFIPQLVEYFLDSHTDKFKKDIFFNKGDIVLDPFSGSGTTLVQANELGLHALGIDISAFNALIADVKLGTYDIKTLKTNINNITTKLKEFQKNKNNLLFENALLNELKIFNDKFFPSPDFRAKVRKGEINEKKYGSEKEKEFLNIYNNLVKKFNLQIKQKQGNRFIDKWFLEPVRKEIDFVFEEIKKIKDTQIKKIIAVILTRTVRSCRATTHSDLGTLLNPQTETYYCKKHGKICKPLFSILNWWIRYGQDTVNRLYAFNKLRTDTFQLSLTGDSRNINIFEEVKKKNNSFYNLLIKQKIKGIFSSPPYVGLIDYHEQHAYSYDLLGYKRKDNLEIGPLSKGQGIEARKSYVKGISEVLINCKKYLQKDYNIFLVANDKYNLYPDIAELAEMKIVNQYKRPVLNRVEKDRNKYSEIIFHLKKK